MTSCLVIFFWIPETQYHRPEIYNIDATSRENLDELAEKEAHLESHMEVTDKNASRTETNDYIVPAKKTYLQRMKPWSGIRRADSPLTVIFSPLKQTANPAVIWVRR